jgi:hypothetical protein
MRDIESSNKKQKQQSNTTQHNTKQTNEVVHITLLLDTILVAKARNILQAQSTQGQFTQQSLSSLVRNSLELYQAGKLKLLPYTPNKKKENSIRFPQSLYLYYQSVDKGKRSHLVNTVLYSYLQQL